MSSEQSITPENPYKFDERRQTRYLGLLKRGWGRTKAAIHVGVTPKTVIRLMASNPDFAEAVEVAETVATDDVEASLFRMTKTNPGAATKWLEHKRPEVWRHKPEPVPGSSPETPLYVAPGQINWDAIPDDLAAEFLEVHRKILELQPASGGLIVEGSMEIREPERETP